MSVVRTWVEAFSVSSGGQYVAVRKDDDLQIKFKRGEIAVGDTGKMTVAMVLGIDDDHTDLIVVDAGGDVRECLAQIREAAELALDGLREAHS